MPKDQSATLVLNDIPLEMSYVADVYKSKEEFVTLVEYIHHTYNRPIVSSYTKFNSIDKDNRFEFLRRVNEASVYGKILSSDHNWSVTVVIVEPNIVMVHKHHVRYSYSSKKYVVNFDIKDVIISGNIIVILTKDNKFLTFTLDMVCVNSSFAYPTGNVKQWQWTDDGMITFIDEWGLCKLDCHDVSKTFIEKAIELLSVSECALYGDSMNAMRRVIDSVVNDKGIIRLIGGITKCSIYRNVVQ